MSKTKQGYKIVNYLMDMGIYIATHARGKDPLMLGSIIARKLRLHSIDTESLLTAIYAVKHFGIDDDLKEEAERVISKTREYKELDKLLRQRKLG